MITKYFIPSIEDIRVGYELEWKIKKVDWCEYGDKSVYDWQPHIITQMDFDGGELGDDFHSFGNSNCEFRVPYLTKESIIARGWEQKNFNTNKATVFCFEKGNYLMIVDFVNDVPFLDFILKDPAAELKRVHDPERFRFWCNCKDINTFKLIESLLNIPS